MQMAWILCGSYSHAVTLTSVLHDNYKTCTIIQMAWILFCMVNLWVFKTVMQWVRPLYCMILIRQYTVIQITCNSVLHGKYVGLTVMQWV
jgi:hypothetical protein